MVFNKLRFLLSLVIVCLLSSPMLGQDDMKVAVKNFELQNYADAIPGLKSSLEKDAGNYNLMFKIGYANYMQGIPAEAIVWFNKAIENGLEKDDAILLLAQAYKMAGDLENAKKYFEKYKIVDPETAVYFVRSCEYAEFANASSDKIAISPIDMNTNSREMFPFVHKGELVFASDRKDIKRLMVKKDQEYAVKNKVQLFSSTIFSKDEIDEPIFLRSDIKPIFNRASVSMSKDMTIAFTKGRFDKENRINAEVNDWSIHFADVNNKGDWEEEIAFQHNLSGYSNAFPYLSKDGKTLFFASNRPGGFGGFDIYVSEKMGAVWSKPENLGPEINTKGNEITPFIHKKELYFSSDWHIGLGGFDIFRALVDSYKNWHIFNLGAGPNSAMDDYGLVFESGTDRSYFCSNRNRISKEDIFYAEISYNPEKVIASAIIAKHEAVSEESGVEDVQNGESANEPMSTESIESRSSQVEDVKTYYSIQIGSFSQQHFAEEKISSPKQNMPIFQEKTGDKVKVKIGLFDKKLDASAMLSVIREDYPDAFIVLHKQSESATAAIQNTPQQPTQNVKQNMKGGADVHKIRLAAYKEPKWFNPKGLDKYGKLKTMKQGELTIFILEIQGSKSHAYKVLNALKATDNFKGARLVKEENGVFRYLSE